MDRFKQNELRCFKASYKHPRKGSLITISIFAKDTSEAVKRAPSAIEHGTYLLYGIS